MALWSSTSNPKTKTRGSRSISWATPSRSASTYLRTRCCGATMTPAGMLGVDIRIKFLRRRERTGFRKFDGGGNSVLDLGINAGFHSRIEPSAHCGNLVVLKPGTQFFASAVAGIIVLARSDVLLPAVGVTFDKDWTRTLSQAGVGIRSDLP